MKYFRSMRLGCKDIGIIKLVFLSKVIKPKSIILHLILLWRSIFLIFVHKYKTGFAYQFLVILAKLKLYCLTRFFFITFQVELFYLLLVFSNKSCSDLKCCRKNWDIKKMWNQPLSTIELPTKAAIFTPTKAAIFSKVRPSHWKLCFKMMDQPDF